jgi:FkbM family methyltransferase
LTVSPTVLVRVAAAVLSGPVAARRSWRRLVAAPFTARHYRAVWNTFRLGVDPWSTLRRYLFGGGDYPYVCRVRTPVGTVGVTLFGPDDVLTLNEVFFREDYRVGTDIRTAVDFGSNIGVSALYFLTRNASCRAYLFEPDPRNVERLRGNLAAFEGRFRLHEHAVADSHGEFEFGVEETGRYGGIGVETGAAIRVRGVDVNAVLGEILAEEDEVDVLKVDIEGLEPQVVGAIRPDLLERIRTIYVEAGEGEPVLQSGAFARSLRGQCLRLERRTAEPT